MMSVSSCARRVLSATLFALALAASTAGAQQIEIEKAPEGRDVRPRVVPPPGLHDVTRPRESDFYPDDIRVRHDPELPVASRVTHFDTQRARREQQQP